LAWTPDGRLLYTAYVGERQTIWAMNRDASNPQQLTLTTARIRLSG
jgi:Tol biopolymer transport system component